MELLEPSGKVFDPQHLLAWLRPRRRILLARQQQQQQPVEDHRCTVCNAHCTPLHGIDV